MPSKIVIADTSVLVNFLRINRMDLIGKHASAFIATEHVSTEITDSYPDQQLRYRAALDSGHLSEECVDDPAEVALFVRLSQYQRLGAGERSAIAVAMNRGLALAIDDNRAIGLALQESGLAGTSLRIIRTQDIVVDLVKLGALSVETADAILIDWATNHRFRLKISSIAEIL